MPDGVYPAMVTPFLLNGTIDEAGVAKLLARFRAAGCKGAVVAGTNGEGPSLSAIEKRDLVALAAGFDPEVQIILGIATPSLTEAIWLTKQAAKAGAVAVLVMAPFYFREASSEGYLEWFRAVLNSSPLPVLLYNFPQRCGFSFDIDFLTGLADHPNLAGLKDSSGVEANLSAFKTALSDKKLFVGNELLLMKALEAGWNGTISGAANVIPRWLSQIVADTDAVKFDLVVPTIEVIRTHPQPATNKANLAELGVIDHDFVRLPLLGASPVALPLGEF